MFTRLLLFINPVVSYVRRKYSDIRWADAIKWGLIILLMLYIVSKISAIAVGIFTIIVLVFIGVKVWQNYILPRINKD